MKSILTEDVACNYELSWQSSPAAIIIRMHRKVVTHAGRVDETSNAVRDYKNALGISEFCPQLASSFGFGKKFLPSVARDGFIELEARLPSQEERSLQKEVRKMIASLDILLSHLNTQTVADDVGMLSDDWQLFTVNLDTELLHGDFGRDITGEFSSGLLDWLTTHHEDNDRGVKGVCEAMKHTYRILSGKQKADSSSFQARIIGPSGYLLLSCPGDKSECELRPKSYAQCRKAFKEAHGCEFGTHNVQTDIQQLILLSGLARLHDIARQHMA